MMTAKQPIDDAVALADGWIAHDGGICPVDPEALVMYKLRHGWASDGPVMAGYCRWDHGRSPEAAQDADARRSDIIAYRIATS